MPTSIPHLNDLYISKINDACV